MRRATLSGAEAARASHGGFAPGVSASAYFDAPSALPRATVEPARLTRSFHATRRTAGYEHAWTGVYGEHGGVGKSAVRLSAVSALKSVLPDDGTRRGAEGRASPLNELELDVNTANVLAKQQAQLLELHAQVESLKAQLSQSRGRAAGDALEDATPPTMTNGSATMTNAVDASTNTLWRPTSVSRNTALSSVSGSETRPGKEQDDVWSYEGGGRKSRGVGTDGGGGDGSLSLSGDVFVTADDPMRRSSRSGLRVIRRSFVACGPGDGAEAAPPGTSASAPRLSPAKPSDLAADASGSAGQTPGFASMPPLPPPSRPDMRAIRRRELVAGEVEGEGEPAATYAPPPTATAATTTLRDARDAAVVDGTRFRSLATSGEQKRLETADFGGLRDSFPDSSQRLIPSRNSAFTPVAGEALGGDGRATALRAAEPTPSETSEHARAGRASRLSATGARREFGDASFGAQSVNHNNSGLNDTHKMRVVAPPRSFARVPLFAEGDGSPSSPGRDDDDADSEVLRVSRDTFAELSLRGAAEGSAALDEDDDELDLDDDETDAGTAVTGTTTGRGASEWALPARWRGQRMSEAACWEGEERRETKDADSGSGDDASASPGRTMLRISDDASYLSPPALGGGSARPSPRRARSRDSDSDERSEKEYAWPGDAAAEDVPTITYQPMSDDESSDDEEMRAIYAKYSVGATTR
jgi:hypothetical protein